MAPGPKQGSQLQAFGDNSISRALTESFRNAESKVHCALSCILYNLVIDVYRSIKAEVAAPGFRR